MHKPVRTVSQSELAEVQNKAVNERELGNFRHADPDPLSRPLYMARDARRSDPPEAPSAPRLPQVHRPQV